MKTAERPLHDLHRGVGTPRHERIPTTPLADDPHPAEARALGASGYSRLHVGTWRVLYRPDDTTVTVHVLKVGRST
ncbi:type II toxin-antitoxin system RelE/ParE family toxin [Streptomyces collinus]|uniref:type II toxin-antitoxin system RelE family toxin n=1 Tax=Streptomyces collinus TaxID=42684 RepID=UPI0036EBFC5E